MCIAGNARQSPSPLQKYLFQVRFLEQNSLYELSNHSNRLIQSIPSLQIQILPKGTGHFSFNSTNKIGESRHPVGGNKMKGHRKTTSAHLLPLSQVFQATAVF